MPFFTDGLQIIMGWIGAWSKVCIKCDVYSFLITFSSAIVAFRRVGLRFLSASALLQGGERSPWTSQRILNSIRAKVLDPTNTAIDGCRTHHHTRIDWHTYGAFLVTIIDMNMQRQVNCSRDATPVFRRVVVLFMKQYEAARMIPFGDYVRSRTFPRHDIDHLCCDGHRSLISRPLPSPLITKCHIVLARDCITDEARSDSSLEKC